MRPIITSDNPKLHEWRQLVAASIPPGVEPLDGPVSLTVLFELPRPKSLRQKDVAHTKRPDLDKLVRAIGDALTGVVYRDDSQVVDIRASKAYGAQPGVWVSVSSMEPWIK